MCYETNKAGIPQVSIETREYTLNKLYIGRETLEKRPTQTLLTAASKMDTVRTREGPSIAIKIGTLADQQVDVLVNSTRSDLFLDGGGVSSALFKAAGASIQDECNNNRPSPLNPGDIVVTSGGNLKVKSIFHGFCGNWNEGKGLQDLKTFVGNALKEADKRQYASIAFPAVGTGKLKYPRDIVARVMIEEIKAFGATHRRTTLRDIRIVLFPDDKDTIKAFNDYFKSLLPQEEQSKFRELKKTEKLEDVYYTVEKRELLAPSNANTVSTSETKTVSRESFKDVKSIGELWKSLLSATSSTGPDFKALQKASEGISLPSKWTTMKPGEVCVLVSLNKGDPEYTEVAKNFTPGNIQEIRRVQNPVMYQLYALRKQQMNEANPNLPNERILYHGTAASSIENINHYGFNRSYCGKNATVYGQGVYFAVDPRYSAQATYSPADSSGNRYIYQARVLAGRSTPGNNSMKEPPYLNGSSGKRYDSVTDGSGKIVVIFYDPQAYPEYLITFQ